MADIRQRRVNALCDWLAQQLCTGNPATLPGFRMLFGDLTEAEMAAVDHEMTRRAALEREGQQRELGR